MSDVEEYEFQQQEELKQKLKELKETLKVDKLVQEHHKRYQAIDSGEDERGSYDIVPLSMVRGGEAQPMKVHTEPMKHLVLDQGIAPRGWYKDKHTGKRVRPRPCYTEALLTSPYGGFCHVGCSFCYINNGSRGYKSTGLPTVDPAYPEKYKKQFDKLMVAGAGYMSSFTEVFQILEDEYHVTERLTKVFTDAKLPIFYCTRRLPPDWAIDALAENPYSYIQWSVNTGDPKEYKKLSPGAARWEDIMEYVARLSERGVYTSFQCNPINAGITTLESLFHLIEVAADAGLDHIIFKFTEQVANNRKLIVDRLVERHFDQKAVNRFDSWFSQVIGGVYTIRQDIRISWLRELLAKTREEGISQSLCYEYYDDGKAGSNMAPWFTTSDQCHGRGIPIHYREKPGGEFKPFPCYRKGCLYCEQAGTMACDNDTLLEARALQYKDLREIILVEPEDGWDWSIPESCEHPSKVRYADACNPNLVTDAEMWGWPDLETVVNNKMDIYDIDDWLEERGL